MVERLRSGIRLVPLPHTLITLHSQEGGEPRRSQPEDTARDSQRMHPRGERTWHDARSPADSSLHAGSALLLGGVDSVHTKLDSTRQSGNAADADNGANFIAAVTEPDAAEGTHGRRQPPDEMQPTAQARSCWHIILLVRHPS